MGQSWRTPCRFSGKRQGSVGLTDYNRRVAYLTPNRSVPRPKSNYCRSTPASSLIPREPFLRSSLSIERDHTSRCYPLGRRISPMYRTREQTIPSYSQHTSTLVPLIFSSKLHKALAAAVTLGIKCLKCGLNVHWLSMVRPRFSSEAPPRHPVRLYPNTGRAEEPPYAASRKTKWPPTWLGTCWGPAWIKCIIYLLFTYLSFYYLLLKLAMC